MSERRRLVVAWLLALVVVALFLVVVLGPPWVLLVLVSTGIFCVAWGCAYAALGVLADALESPKDTSP